MPKDLTPEILREVNRNLKRRLTLDSQNLLVDSIGTDVDEEFCGAQTMTLFRGDPNRLKDPTRPYVISGLDPLRGEKFISSEEAKIILGIDYQTVADEWDIPAMLKACSGGMRGANSYWLGPTEIQDSDCANISVAYFRIPKVTHLALSGQEF